MTLFTKQSLTASFLRPQKSNITSALNHFNGGVLVETKMTLIKLIRIQLIKVPEIVKPLSGLLVRNNSNSTPCETPNKAKEETSDLPIKLKRNPFEEEKPKCILCKYDIEPSYKNVRLLSQFTSRHTGKIFGRYITGLCKAKQDKLEKEIKRAQSSGLMGVYTKDKNFLADPVLYDCTKPFKVL